MKTLHFGAGNIGRGFIGKLLADASHQVTFADVNETLIDQLNHRQEYKVHVVGTDQKLDVVRNVAAVSSAGHEVIARIITAASTSITTMIRMRTPQLRGGGRYPRRGSARPPAP